MAKLSIKVPAVTTSIDRENLYLDVESMDKLTVEMDSTISTMIKTLGNIKSQFSRLEKHFTSNSYKKQFRKAMNNIEAETNKLKTRRKGLKSKYESDRNDIKVSVLEEKIIELEKVVNGITGKDASNLNNTNSTPSNDSTANNYSNIESKTTLQDDGQTKTTTISTNEQGIKQTTDIWTGEHGQTVSIISEDTNTGKMTWTVTTPDGQTSVQDITNSK